MIWVKKQTHYPDSFNDVLFEFAKEEERLGYEDTVAYAEWYVNSQPTTVLTWPPGAEYTPPPGNRSAAKEKEWYHKLKAMLKGHPDQKLLEKFTIEIMNRTSDSARRVGNIRAQDHPTYQRYRKSGLFR